MEKNWKKLDPEDRGTWPFNGQLCWVTSDCVPSENPWCLWGDAFNDCAEELMWPVAKVTHWSPATPPPFDGE